MPIPSSCRAEFDEAGIYEYPAHLHESLASLPTTPGVYFFHAGDGERPLYIGKSVNLRSRVMSHLRNADEARMLRHTQRISHIDTAGELGALLLEAQLIKQHQPLHNQLLRRVKPVCAWRVHAGRPEVVFSNQHDFAHAGDLYGLYSCRQSAEQALRSVADQHRLCYGALGLEKLAAGRACFRATLRQCAGVCRGDETTASHTQRLQGVLDDLRLTRWPYPGAVAVVERGADRARDYLVLCGWGFAGRASTLAAARRLARQPMAFDADVYKIAHNLLQSGRAELLFIGDQAG